MPIYLLQFVQFIADFNINVHRDIYKVNIGASQSISDVGHGVAVPLQAKMGLWHKMKKGGLRKETLISQGSYEKGNLWCSHLKITVWVYLNMSQILHVNCVNYEKKISWNFVNYELCFNFRCVCFGATTGDH